MNKILLQAVGLLFFSSLLVQEAASGGTDPMVTAEFNTFVFEAAGPIQNLGGAGEFLQSSRLSTTFDIAGGMVGAFSLGLAFTGPGTDGFEPIIDLNNMICTEGQCSFSGMFDFEAPMIAAGDIYAAAGEIFYMGSSLDSPVTAADSFVAYVPEPAVFALIATGLFGIAFTRRKTAC